MGVGEMGVGVEVAGGSSHAAKPTARPSDRRPGAMRRHVSRLPLLAPGPSCSKPRPVGAAILVGRVSTPGARATEVISASSMASPRLMGVQHVQMSDWVSHWLLLAITTKTTTNTSSPTMTVSPITAPLLLGFIASPPWPTSDPWASRIPAETCYVLRAARSSLPAESLRSPVGGVSKVRS